MDATTNPATLVFEYQDAAGLHARKEFQLDPRTYVIGFSASVMNGTMPLNPAIQWGPGLGDAGATSGGGSFFTGNYVQPPSAIYHRDDDVERLLPDSLLEQPAHEGQFRFAGLDDHYFIAVAVNPGQARVEYRPVTLPGEGETQRQLLDQTFRFPQAPEKVRFFYGPKQFEQLRDIDAQLVYAINFGIFQFLAVPLLGALTWIHGYVGNWGWAIILLTILINIVVFPLRHKSVVSMRKMQMLQPQMKAIQDRYAGMKVTDPARQKMNTEVMNLYREKGVNPASGCVPMVLQMPLLFAFYSMLSQAIELRGADFGLWIHDLSQADPYFVVPILMAGLDVLAAEDHADDGGPGAAADHDDDAADVQRDVPVGAERPGDLLVREQRLGDRPAVLHRLVARPGPPVDDEAAGGAAAEECRRGEISGSQEGLIGAPSTRAGFSQPLAIGS